MVAVRLLHQRSEQPGRTQPYPKAFIQAMRLIPIQEGGRVKPLDTWVSFMLYRIHGMR